MRSVVPRDYKRDAVREYRLCVETLSLKFRRSISARAVLSGVAFESCPHAPLALSSCRGAREASCADFGVGVWGFNPKPE